MMKTALSIAQSTFRRINEPTVSSLTGLTDQDDLQVLHLLYAVCEHLRRKGPFRQQVQTHEFDTVASTNTYPLPGDYYGPVPNTHYNQDTDLKLIGPLNDADFMAFKEGQLEVTAEYAFRIKGFDENTASESGRQIELYPTPSDAENLTFEYITGHLFIPANWAASTAYSLNDYVNVNGRIYQCSSAGTSSSTPPSGTTDAQSDGTAEWNHVDTPFETINADTDYCIFDEELVKLGLRAFYAEEQGGMIAEAALRDFRRSIKSMKYRFDGQTRIRGDRSGMNSVHKPYVSVGSWSFSN